MKICFFLSKHKVKNEKIEIQFILIIELALNESFSWYPWKIFKFIYFYEFIIIQILYLFTNLTQNWMNLLFKQQKLNLKNFWICNTDLKVELLARFWIQEHSISQIMTWKRKIFWYKDWDKKRWTLNTEWKLCFLLNPTHEYIKEVRK